MKGTILRETLGNILFYPRKLLTIVLFEERFSVIIFLGPEEKNRKHFFHKAFLCLAEKSTIKSTILGAIGVPEPL